MSLSGDARNEHERQVADFLRQAQAANPSLYDEVTARHTVLTESQLASRRAKELSNGLIEDVSSRWGGD